MIIGIPKEIKNNENRVALTPAGAKELVKRGHTVYVQHTAGINSGFADDAYVAAGARILPAIEDVYGIAEMIVKVKEPIASEYPLVRKGQLVFTYFHFASDEALTLAMIKSGSICLAYETVENPDHTLPLLIPMSEVAGRMSVQEGARFLEKPQGGKGVLLGGVPGVKPGKVLVLGGGVVGHNAALMAAGLGADVKELYVDSNGYHADYPRFFRKAQKKLAREQRRLSHCEKGSSRYKKQQKKVARIHTHIAHQRKDFLHKESRKITNFYDLVCIESLNMKEMSQDSRFGKSVHDNGWGMFTNYLSYKLERAGKKLIRIDPWYPSSKRCSCCGKIKKDLKLDDRIYDCECGNRMNRDENAAVNICREGLRMAGNEMDAERKIS